MFQSKETATASDLLVPNLISTVVNTKKGDVLLIGAIGLWRCEQDQEGERFPSTATNKPGSGDIRFSLGLKLSSKKKSGTALVELRTASEGEWITTRT